jgi:hypothetical protein
MLQRRRGVLCLAAIGSGELVLTDFLFFPDARIENGAQLVTAIHAMNPLQQTAMVTSAPLAARRNLPKALRSLPILRKPFRMSRRCDCCGSPCCRFDGRDR